MCVQQCHPIGVLSLKNQCPPCLQKRSFCPPADFQPVIRRLADAEKNLLLIQSYKCLLMVLRGMSKAGCYLLSFRTLQQKRVFNKSVLTLNSFSNNTYTSYTYMHIHQYEYIYISFVIAFCGVGYFKGLKHSIFKSCHQIPISVLGTWCAINFLPYAVYLRMSNTFLRMSSLVGQKHKN
jgi:hypothetical protein